MVSELTQSGEGKLADETNNGEKRIFFPQSIAHIKIQIIVLG